MRKLLKKWSPIVKHVIAASSLFLLNPLWISNAQARHPQEMTSKILLIINKQPITERDLAQRIKLLTFSSGGKGGDIEDSQKAKILEALIHESIQIQAAQRKKVSVTDAEIMAAIEEMAKENEMTGQQLLELLKSNGINKATLLNRVKAQIYWAKYIRQQFAPLVYVSDTEAQEHLKKMNSEKGKKEYLISEIVLTNRDPKYDSQTRETADKLVRDLRNGAKFSALARDLSQASSASKGGELGWIAESALDHTIAAKVTQLRVGQISDPIKVSEGYKILLLKDLRHSGTPSIEDMQVTLAQAIIPISAQPTEEEMVKYGPVVEDLMGMSGCKSFLTKAKSDNLQAQENKGIRLGQLPDPIKKQVQSSPLGKPLQPIMTPNGLILTMVCERQAAKPIVTTKEDVSATLEQTKYGSRAMRELQKLMTNAYIEVKDESIRKYVQRYTVPPSA